MCSLTAVVLLRRVSLVSLQHTHNNKFFIFVSALVAVVVAVVVLVLVVVFVVNFNWTFRVFVISVFSPAF